MSWETSMMKERKKERKLNTSKSLLSIHTIFSETSKQCRKGRNLTYVLLMVSILSCAKSSPNMEESFSESISSGDEVSCMCVRRISSAAPFPVCFALLPVARSFIYTKSTRAIEQMASNRRKNKKKVCSLLCSSTNSLLSLIFIIYFFPKWPPRPYTLSSNR